MLLVLALMGCGGTSGSSLRLASVSHPRQLRPEPTTRVYRFADQNTADAYLTDLPPALWNPDADFRGVSATIIHLHTFIEPRAGRTPIADGASNMTVRYLVLSNGQVGLYGGGGFLWRSGDPGDSTFGGELRGASLKLLRATPGFHDLLGPCELHGSFSAARQEEDADQIEAIFQSLQLAIPNSIGK